MSEGKSMLGRLKDAKRVGELLEAYVYYQTLDAGIVQWDVCGDKVVMTTFRESGCSHENTVRRVGVSDIEKFAELGVG